MALWIQNVTGDPSQPDDQAHDYVVRVNNGRPLAHFQHVRTEGAAACFRAAADALDRANPHQQEDKANG